MAKIVKRLDTGATLRTIAVGETLDIPFRDISPNSIVGAVRRTNTRMGIEMYKAELHFKEFKTSVTRIA